MKIQKINTNGISKTKYRPITQNFSKIAFSGDIFESKIKKSKFSEDFLKIVTDRAQQQKIFETVLCDSSGNCDKNAESFFIETVETSLEYLQEMNRSPEYKDLPTLVEAARISLAAARNEDGFGTDKDILAILTTIAFMSLKDGDTRVEELFSLAKYDDGKILFSTIQNFLIYSTYRDPQISAQDIVCEIMRYCLDEEGKINTSGLYATANLLNTAQTDTLDESDMVIATLINKNGEITAEKYDFYLTAIENLKEVARKDYNADEDAQFAHGPKTMMFVILKAIIDNAADKDGDFSTEKAQKALEDWRNYADLQKEALNKEIELEVNFSTPNGETETKKISIQEYKDMGINDSYFYDSTLYRMFRLLS